MSAKEETTGGGGRDGCHPNPIGPLITEDEMIYTEITMATTNGERFFRLLARRVFLRRRRFVATLPLHVWRERIEQQPKSLVGVCRRGWMVALPHYKHGAESIENLHILGKGQNVQQAGSCKPRCCFFTYSSGQGRDHDRIEIIYHGTTLPLVKPRALPCLSWRAFVSLFLLARGA